MRRYIYNFAIDPELREGLRRFKARDGIPESEQIRRAINDWLQKTGVMKSGHKRAGTSKRS